MIARLRLTPAYIGFRQDELARQAGAQVRPENHQSERVESNRRIAHSCAMLCVMDLML